MARAVHVERYRSENVVGGAEASLVVDGNLVYRASVVAVVLRCRLWALVNGYGWPPVRGR
jgi:hypothetical protein